MEPPSTTLCAGYAGGLAASVDRGSIPRRLKLQAGTRKRRVNRTRTEGRKKRKNIERNRSKGIDSRRPVTEARLIQRICLNDAKGA
jgi:hypothetical protein